MVAAAVHRGSPWRYQRTWYFLGLTAVFGVCRKPSLREDVIIYSKLGLALDNQAIYPWNSLVVRGSVLSDGCRPRELSIFVALATIYWRKDSITSCGLIEEGSIASQATVSEKAVACYRCTNNNAEFFSG